MPTNVYKTRRDNLRRYIAERGHGAVRAISFKLGHSSGSFLSQVAGPNPRRQISEKTARAIEERLGLGEGFLDVLHNHAAPAPPAPHVDELVVAQAAPREAPSGFADSQFGPEVEHALEGISRATVLVHRAADQEGVHATPEQFAELVRLTFEVGERTGHADDEALTERLVRLAKGASVAS